MHHLICFPKFIQRHTTVVLLLILLPLIYRETEGFLLGSPHGFQVATP